ncbi:putative ribonuclease H-like domain-containing protein [Tanacetum coccineum]
MVAQGYTQEEGINYDEVFSPVARIEAIRIFLAYASFKDFMVYQMDVKSAFLYGKIEEEVYVCQPLGFEDLDFPDRRGKIDKTLFIKRDKGDILLVQVYVDDIIFGSTKKSLCSEFEKMMHKKFQMNSIGELTFFLGLTPMETQKPLLKDEDGEEVDVHLYRSMIGSLMYLTSSRPDIMFAVKTVNGEQQLQVLVDGKKIIVAEASVRRGLQLYDEEGTDCLSNDTIFEDLTRMGYEKLSQKLTFYNAFFSSQWKFLIHTILQCLSAKTTACNEFSSTMASAIICSEVPIDPHHTPIITQPSSSQPQRKQKSRRPKEKETQVPQSSVLSDPTNMADEAVNEEPSMQLKELMDFYTKLQQRVLDLENTKTTQAQEITSLKKRVKKLEKKGGSRTHKLKRLYRVGRSARVVSFKEAKITLVDETQGRYTDEDMFGVNDLDGDEVVVDSEVTNKASEKRNIVEEAVDVADDVTILSARPKTKGVVMKEPSESTPTISLQLPSQVKGQGLKDKGKIKMIEPDKPLKKNDQIKFDEEEALRIQAKFDEEDRLARKKAQQAQEQQELTIEEKSTLFIQLLEKRKKHFTAKRAEEKRNMPPTRAQQRSIMCTYLKNMAGWKPKDLKNKSFANIQELFDKAFKRVNTFVNFRIELVEGTKMEESSKKAEVIEESSLKRAGDELEQENAKK